MLPVVFIGQGRGVDQAHDELAALPAFARVKQLINEALPSAAAVDERVFKINQLAQVLLNLERAPAGERPRIALAEPLMPLLDFLGGASLARHLVQHVEEPARLRRHFIEAAAKDFARQSVRCRDVIERDFDMLEVWVQDIGNASGSGDR